MQGGYLFNYRDYDFENYIEVEEGADGFIYGNYVDFPRFRQDFEEELLLDAGVYILFGETNSIEEYIDIIYNLRHLVNDYIFDQLKEKVFDGDFSFNSESVVKFIDRDNNLADELVNYILDNYGVPDDYVYEYDLPDKFKYWYDPSDEQEYLDYINYPIELDEFDRQVKSNFDLINTQKAEIIKKSLILASLILAESLLKSVILKGLPEYNYMPDFYKHFIRKKVGKDITYDNSRQELFKMAFNKKAPEQGWVNLRNSLAHDIGNAYIEKNLINYYNMRDKKADLYDIDQLRIDLIEFGNNLKGIIYKN